MHEEVFFMKVSKSGPDGVSNDINTMDFVFGIFCREEGGLI